MSLLATVQLAVVGAHLAGQPLNPQLTDRGATLVRACKTKPVYQLFALETKPPKPGLSYVGEKDGAAIEIEIWELNVAAFGSFVAAVPPPLAIGTVFPESGDAVMGFVCEGYALVSARDITSFGGWRAYLAQK